MIQKSGWRIKTEAKTRVCVKERVANSIKRLGRYAKVSRPLRSMRQGQMVFSAMAVISLQVHFYECSQSHSIITCVCHSRLRCSYTTGRVQAYNYLLGVDQSLARANAEMLTESTSPTLLNLGGSMKQDSTWSPCFRFRRQDSGWQPKFLDVRLCFS